jgi:hypothetical protein
MCIYCHSFPHDARCPNAPEPPLFGRCEECGAEIYDGDEYYEIGDHVFCEACVKGGYRTAEVFYD